MKKYILFLVCIILQSLPSHGDDQSLFARGNELFLQSDWTAAISSYRSIKNKTSVVWQNVGSCYFNDAQYCNALLSWRRAYEGCSFSSISTLIDLEKRAMSKLNIEAPFRSYFLFKRIVLFIPLWLCHLMIIVLLIYILYTLICCWRWQEITSSDRKRLFKIGFLLFLSSLFWHGNKIFFSKNIAMVVKSEVLVYAGPERTFHIVNSLPQASLVQALQRNQGMYQITKNSLTGWVTQDALEFIYNDE